MDQLYLTQLPEQDLLVKDCSIGEKQHPQHSTAMLLKISLDTKQINPSAKWTD